MQGSQTLRGVVLDWSRDSTYIISAERSVGNYISLHTIFLHFLFYNMFCILVISESCSLRALFLFVKWCEIRSNEYLLDMNKVRLLDLFRSIAIFLGLSQL